jgi:hypothetical protein
MEDGSAGASKARMDGRTVPRDYYLSRAKVDVWAKEGLDDLLKGFVAADNDEVSSLCFLTYCHEQIPYLI